MQVLLDKTINIVSIKENGLLIHSTCLFPFYSSDNIHVAFWVQDYDYQNDLYLSTYQLYLKNLKTNKLQLVNTGNGTCPLPPNTSSNETMYNASFSPDGTKILFLTTSTNLVGGDTLLSGTLPDKNRWYVYDITQNSFKRVSSTNSVYGNSYDANEALWYDNTNVAVVSYSSNLVSGISQNSHSEVYLKNISSGNVIHISRREDSNLTPYFVANCNNIAVTNNKVSFFSYEIGFVIKNIADSSLTRVQDLPGISSYGIVTPETMYWSNDGTKMMFRISSGTTITPDTNGMVDDFVYNFNTNTIIPINENSGDTVYGNGYSVHASFSPDSSKVAFISNSYNIDPTSTNPIDNLYVKDLSTRILTRISKSTSNGNITNNILGYTWLNNTKLAFTSFANNIVSGDTNTVVDWFVRDTTTNITKRINFNNTIQIFSENNQFQGLIRKETFNNSGSRILFSTKITSLNPTFYTPSYNEYDIFEKIFDEEYVPYPSIIGQSVEANDSINAYVDNGKLIAYTSNDSITGTPTYSIVGSVYVERVNSITNRNVNSNIRWMSFNYPNLPYNTPSPSKIGFGVFNSSPTLLDDIIDIKQHGQTTTQNPVHGIVTLLSVRPQNDIVLVTAGPDQQRICDPIVYLEATIQGNTSGHTFLWELISGEAVSLFVDTQTRAHYVVDGSSRNRIFRFWIDKGKYNEQYQDLTIFSTPTDYFNLNSAVLTSSLNTTTDPLLQISVYSFTVPQLFDYTIPNNSSASYNESVVGLTWSLPDIYTQSSTVIIDYYKSNFIGTTLEVNINGVWQVLTNVLGTSAPRVYTPVYVGFPLRIGSVFNTNGHIKTYYTSVFVASPQLSANEIFSRNDITSKIVSTINYNILSKTNYDLDDTITYHTYSTGNNVVTKTSTILSMTKVDVDDTISINNITSNLSYLIARTNGAVIGG